ncbi:hypothetical protein OTV1_063 [Ostreococcus tauri virus 1]|uniref:hypothetical protein n=1 Tax=Ostreococcus tauri virus 1 TaxID=642926 RepID=UPI0001B5F64C|nr:hypothetical protein OTV1_063 [Ostreococcus tauri virus 1]CAY39651.1 hypothetical protein OTV1_063 [Ostreococcus tauri virus 1]
MARIKSRSKCGVLMGCVSELSNKLGFASGWLGAAILLGFSHLINSVESWNAHSILSCSENLKRWWRKSVVPIHLGSYCEILFNFSNWPLGHEVPSAGQHLLYIGL